MMRASIRAPMAPRALLFASLVAAAGCGHKIGDSCTQNVDCSPLGDRFCDLASPGGYCTIQGCDVMRDANGNPLLNSDGTPQTSCPDEAVCVRFFQQLADCPCDPALPDDCAPSQHCLCDEADPANPGRCAVPQSGGVSGQNPSQCAASGSVTGTKLGHCAPESSERRSCQLKCSKDGDCRQPQYQCRSTGTHGAEPVPTSAVPLDGGAIAVGVAASFCVQSGQ